MQQRVSHLPASPLPGRRARREGFTLIELLVVIGILLLLTTIAVAAYRGVTSADRVSGAARNFKTSLEGARSRAIADGQPRGIRLVLDPNIPHVVTSVVPIGAAEYHEGVFYEIRNDASGSPIGGNRWRCFDPTLTLRRIDQRALSQLGTRIEVPAYSGRWYPLLSYEDVNMNGVLEGGEDTNGNTRLDMFEDTDIDGAHLTAGGADADSAILRGELFLEDDLSGTAGIQSFDSVPYRLQLAPPVLPGAEPVVFPRGVGIDLNGSAVPDAWRATPSAPDQFSSHMDIMFASNGTLTGGLAGAGLIHLYFADVEDIERAAQLREAVWGHLPVTNIDFPRFIVPAMTVNPPPASPPPAAPQSTVHVVTIFTQTGMSVVADVDHTDTFDTAADPPDNMAAAPFRFATEGREAK
jgi:prepilin-type N-terminal cleavage/methylation domain-containing protein